MENNCIIIRPFGSMILRIKNANLQFEMWNFLYFVDSIRRGINQLLKLSFRISYLIRLYFIANLYNFINLYITINRFC